MLIYSKKEALEMVKHNNVGFPILVVSVPARCCEFGLVAQNSDQLFSAVDVLLEKSSYCPEPSVHLTPKGEKSDHPFWRNAHKIDGPF